MMYLYFIQEGNKPRIKIGLAERPEDRLRQLQTANSHKLIIRRVIENVREGIEEIFHTRLSSRRLNGEWFAVDLAYLLSATKELGYRAVLYRPTPKIEPRKQQQIAARPEQTIYEPPLSERPGRWPDNLTDAEFDALIDRVFNDPDEPQYMKRARELAIEHIIQLGTEQDDCAS